MPRGVRFTAKTGEWSYDFPEAARVRRAFDLWLESEGTLSYAEIGRRVGFRGSWAVQSVLRQPLYKGVYRVDRLWVAGKPEPREPDEIYFRYYLRLAADWNQTLQGGKLPGISGTYGVAGWGGRKSDGTHGWSARGLFKLTIPAGNPLAGTTPIGTYCYHADMKGSYGTNWVWQNDYRGFLENNRWYSIEQYLKMNTPGRKDGILKAWIDGRLAFEKRDIRFRHTPKLKIEQVWMNVYHGGKKPSPYDQHLFIDNVVIAKKYIGSIKLKE